MKTLVIHPYDETTTMLSVIYEDKDWTVITDQFVSKSFLKKSIIDHDRVVMLGHGTPQGLIAMTGFSNFRYLIDSDMVYLLRDKALVAIWCNADQFFDKYDLKGLYTGMIISEWDEAWSEGLSKFSHEDIDNSNTLFSSVMKEVIESDGYDLSISESKYIGEDNEVIEFNRTRIYLK
jgi:hypothetical protein